MCSNLQGLQIGSAPKGLFKLVQQEDPLGNSSDGKVHALAMCYVLWEGSLIVPNDLQEGIASRQGVLQFTFQQ